MPAGRFLVFCALVLIGAFAPRSDAADAGKTLHVAFSIAETSFDPAFASDAASDAIIANVFDTMLDYDYLARPVKLMPRAQGHLFHARSRFQRTAA